MNGSSRHLKLRGLLMLSEAVIITLIILLLWMDEVMDLPHLIFGAPATPLNLTESVLESTIILIMGLILAFIMRKLLRRIQFLEELVPICTSCKKIRDKDGQWSQVEEYFHRKTKADFTHGLCPDCVRKLYPELDGKF